MKTKTKTEKGIVQMTENKCPGIFFKIQPIRGEKLAEIKNVHREY